MLNFGRATGLRVLIKQVIMLEVLNSRYFDDVIIGFSHQIFVGGEKLPKTCCKNGTVHETLNLTRNRIIYEITTVEFSPNSFDYYNKCNKHLFYCWN